MSEIKQRATRVREIEPGVYEYTDGSVRDARGRAVRQIPTPQPITHATASTLAASRWQRVRELAAAGAAEAAREAAERGDPLPVRLDREPLSWIAAIVRARARVALSDSERGGNDAARVVLQAAGIALGDGGDSSESADRTLRDLGAETARALLALLRQRRAERDAANIVDVEPA